MKGVCVILSHLTPTYRRKVGAVQRKVRLAGLIGQKKLVLEALKISVL
jgi:hypothetical protein